MPRRPATTISHHTANRLARSTWAATEKTATHAFRWATTDHTGMREAMDRMPEMGLLDSIKHTLMHFLISIIGTIFMGLWIFVLIAYGIPFLITGKF